MDFSKEQMKFLIKVGTTQKPIVVNPPKPGKEDEVYKIAKSLEDAGFIKVETRSNGQRVYSTTKAGLRYAIEQLEEK